MFAELKYFVIFITDYDSNFDVTLISDTDLFVSALRDSSGSLMFMRISKSYLHRYQGINGDTSRDLQFFQESNTLKKKIV